MRRPNSFLDDGLGLVGIGITMGVLATLAVIGLWRLVA